MKTVFLAALAAMSIFTLSNVLAQAPAKSTGCKTEQKCDAPANHKGGRGYGDREQMMDKMKVELSLTDAQVIKIKELNKATRDKMKVEGADKKLIMKEKMTGMKNILTPEQQKKWVELRKKAEEARKAARGKSKEAGKTETNCCN